jgi:hypothetical protein
MWIAYLVAFVMTAQGSQIMIQFAPTPLHSKAQCEELNAQVEKAIKESPEVKGYVLRCEEVKDTDVKTNGKDS